MSNCPDKDADLEATRAVLEGRLAPDATGQSWLRHGSATGAFDLDLLLARGATEGQLDLARQSWTVHIAHLRTDHGLGVEKGPDGLWRFTGEAHDASGVGSRKTITDEQYRAGYEWGRRVFLGEAEPDEAVAAQVALGTNPGSAQNFIRIVEGLLSGKVFKRAMKDQAYGWYLAWIFRDDGQPGLDNAVYAMVEHLAYRESVGHNVAGIRKSIERYLDPQDRGTKIERSEEGEDSSDRKRKQRLVEARYGQPEFRKKLFNAYLGRCAVTVCSIPELLEAAHIRPYAKDGKSKVTNGILLRSDIHALFDAHLLGFCPDTCSVRVSPVLMCEPEYWQLNGQMFCRPVDAKEWPDAVELRAHLSEVLKA